MEKVTFSFSKCLQWYWGKIHAKGDLKRNSEQKKYFFLYQNI